MGELADRINRLANDVDDYPTPTWAGEFASLADSIAELELRCAMMEAAASLASATFAGAAAPLTNATRAVPDDVLDRLADAEQRAAAAWAAVTELVRSPSTDGDYACVGIHVGSPSAIRYTNPVNTKSLIDNQVSTYNPVHCVTVVFAVNAPANPDLLERASVELAEAYQRAKAEEQRQAEEKATVDASDLAANRKVGS